MRLFGILIPALLLAHVNTIYGLYESQEKELEKEQNGFDAHTYHNPQNRLSAADSKNACRVSEKSWICDSEELLSQNDRASMVNMLQQFKLRTAMNVSLSYYDFH